VALMIPVVEGGRYPILALKVWWIWIADRGNDEKTERRKISCQSESVGKTVRRTDCSAKGTFRRGETANPSTRAESCDGTLLKNSTDTASGTSSCIRHVAPAWATGWHHCPMH